MTKHKPEFAQRTSTPDAEALVDFVEAHGFIYAVKRTRAQLLALVADGKLKASGNRFERQEEMKLSKAQKRMVIFLHEWGFIECGKRLSVTERWCIRNNLVYLNPMPVDTSDLSGSAFRLTDYGKVIARQLTGELAE